jgi:hypothetical protein
MHSLVPPPGDDLSEEVSDSNTGEWSPNEYEEDEHQSDDEAESTSSTSTNVDPEYRHEKRNDSGHDEHVMSGLQECLSGTRSRETEGSSYFKTQSSWQESFQQDTEKYHDA